MVLILSACGKSTRPDTGVNLPAPPRCLAPVDVPPVTKGDDAFEALARSRGALAAANGNLKCSRDWYAGVRTLYKRQNP